MYFSAAFTLAMYLSVPSLPKETSFSLVVSELYPTAIELLYLAFALLPRAIAFSTLLVPVSFLASLS